MVSLLVCYPDPSSVCPTRRSPPEGAVDTHTHTPSTPVPAASALGRDRRAAGFRFVGNTGSLGEALQCLIKPLNPEMSNPNKSGRIHTISIELFAETAVVSDVCSACILCRRSHVVRMYHTVQYVWVTPTRESWNLVQLQAQSRH